METTPLLSMGRSTRTVVYDLPVGGEMELVVGLAVEGDHANLYIIGSDGETRGHVLYKVKGLLEVGASD